MSSRNLEYLLASHSVALVGASDRPGERRLQLARTHGFHVDSTRDRVSFASVSSWEPEALKLPG